MFPRVDGSSVTVPLTEVDSIVSPTVSPVPNVGAIQQTLVDTDSEDGRPLLQLEIPPEDVINALEADFVGCVAVGEHPGVVLVPQSSQGIPRSKIGNPHREEVADCRPEWKMSKDTGISRSSGLARGEHRRRFRRGVV